MIPYRTALTKYLTQHGIFPNPQWTEADLEHHAEKLIKSELDAQHAKRAAEVLSREKRDRDEWNADPVRQRLLGLVLYRSVGCEDRYFERYQPFVADVPATAPAPAPAPAPVRPHGNSRAVRQLRQIEARTPADALSAFGDFVPWDS
jgi:hypothetical protein